MDKEVFYGIYKSWDFIKFVFKWFQKILDKSMSI